MEPKDSLTQYNEAIQEILNNAISEDTEESEDEEEETEEVE